MPEWICPYKTGTLIKLSVRPGSSKNEIIGIHDGRLKIKIAAPPRDGEANEEIVNFFSKFFKITKKDVEILRGELGRSKDLFVNLPMSAVSIFFEKLI